MTFPIGTPTKVVNLTVKSAAEGKRVNGVVHLTPNVPDIIIAGNPVRWTGGGKYSFDSEGRMVSKTGIGVELLDNSAAGSNPTGWLWQARITVDGKTRGGSFSLDGVSSGVDLNDLLEINPETPKYVPIAGPRGLQGIQGERGIQGLSGEDGEQGERGLQGIQGIQGEDGEQGERGLQGIQGEQGERGLQGIQGEQGEPGANPRNNWVIIDDDDLTGLPEAPTWRVVRTSANTPLQCWVEADPGDLVEVFAGFMYLGSRYFDWVLLDNTGAISLYATTHSSTPPVEGNPGIYPALNISRHPMPPMFVVAENHVDVNGRVTAALAQIGMGAGAGNRVYAHTSYPFMMRVKSTAP